jgi:hypothetical protein
MSNITSSVSSNGRGIEMVLISRLFGASDLLAP